MESNNRYFEVEDILDQFSTDNDFSIIKKNKDDGKIKIDWSKSKLNPEVPIEPKRSKRMDKKLKKQEKAKSKQKWFGVKKVELTDTVKNDLEALQCRGALDTKRFYKRNGVKIGQYFHVGRVVEAPEEYYSSRVPRKQRKNIADEFMAEENKKSSSS